MLSKTDLTQKALEFGFEDVGFTTAEPFSEQREVLLKRWDSYRWAPEMGLDLLEGTDPKTILPEAKAIIVLLDGYFKEAFPRSMEVHFGRCYLDDDRMTGDGLTARLKAFRKILKEDGIDSKVPFHLPHRLAAARAGLGDFGKNCLFYAKRVARQSSWVLPLAIVVDRAFEPDASSIGIGCPSWCQNACLSACPTGALKGPRNIDPKRCISYLSYFGEGITPLALREPMGLWLYGCDHCQNVCPRNRAWMSQDLLVNEKIASRSPFFELRRLLSMTPEYYVQRIWPHMFYMPPDELWRWQMNAARAMGNALDPSYVPDLAAALADNPDERVRGMAAWALGRIGGKEAKVALTDGLSKTEGLVRDEVLQAMASLG